MTTVAPTGALPARSAPVPHFGGVLATDAAALTAYAADGEAVLAALPPRPARDEAQQARAESVLTAGRDARRAFLALHAEAVYDELTAARGRHLRLAELLRAAADRFPGLVPTPAQMAAEDAFVQADKDGREIDQAIFCAAVLRSPSAGAHLVDAMLLPTARALDLLAAFRDAGRVELDSVLVERVGEAGHITFRNAHCLNAEDNRLIRDLETAVDLVLLDDRIRVGVLRGGEVDHPRYRGRRVFSAGINLKDLRNGDISFTEFLLGRELGYINKMYRGLLTAAQNPVWAERTVQKPWIGAVDAFAIGGGMQLLLVLDHVVAEEGAYFSLPAAEEGIVPGLGNLRLGRLTGAREARRVILGGRRITTADPDAHLVCDEVVPAGQLTEAVEAAVRHLSAPAVAANRRMLALTEEPLELFRSYLAEFAVVQVARSYSEDVLAKVERRWQRSQARN
ncbi:(3,5-dihydroxyphenyl)acetyl-CoA 1,2-dioxygenase DpgC [Streptomyces antimicrobicus]|uniref:Enoyl-CoA hydratase/isomerase family protein n=1 Tax=Streptomyces antimicrobicus TaxID=2883108 RepID=A0ABS8BCS5_9ACTN|nr:(3,5-dihydroxyphenyl)acetyl-CoA 1,2-dioxygenase DpgC [Streptomyces antimicrobicus]MCB5182432.1 enoyl-CoA hydratase/isomerase family protein [Streptomyces antimicrobicus]